MKYIRVGFAYAFFSNPSVSQGFVDIKEGDSYKTNGIEIKPDHKHIFVEPFDSMKCRVTFKENWLVKLFRLRDLYYYFFHEPIPYLTYRNITQRTRLVLSKINSVGFDDGWDDSSHSFTEISADEYVPDNRTRRIFDEHQILSPDELIRGKVITYHRWHSGLEKTVPERMIVLQGQFFDEDYGFSTFKGLILQEDGFSGEFWPTLGDCSVTPYDSGYYNNLSYLVDTGETMTEEGIIDALLRIKPVVDLTKLN